ncbi:hypothetical protein H9P43_010085 [Blastocladiella emersonii ATCC 22665]|nr:hypothetical protein H9P43_010085 [Blastocladiella emersonii ATCC 22665]
MNAETRSLDSLAAATPKPIRSICVYCGSSPGFRPEFAAAAEELGKALVARNIRLVYGGGSGGLMGIVARTVHQRGGSVLGIIPTALLAFGGEMIGETITVPDMHTRKQLFNEHADAFVTLPGGLGTAEELFETTTWAQLHIHDKPVLVLNILDFYTPIRTWIENAVENGFVSQSNSKLAQIVDSVPDAMAVIDAASSAILGERTGYVAPDGRTALFKWDGFPGRLQKTSGLVAVVGDVSHAEEEVAPEPSA